jgi:hypothetical protein
MTPYRDQGRRTLRAAPPWLAVGLAACAHAGPPVAPPAPAPAPAAVEALLASPPDAWCERLPPVHALGSAAVPHLLRGLDADPRLPGAPAAVALLGRLGDPSVTGWLAEQVAARSVLAVEAALALGDLHARGALPTLRACVDDRSADATLRTAAACALVRCGDGAAAAPLLSAVVMAGTPAGLAPGRALGLPERPRWALERYLVQRLLLLEGASALAAEFDTDAPWTQLEALGPRIGEWSRQRR